MSTTPIKRCGKCANCLHVETVKRQALRAFAQADVQRVNGRGSSPTPIGEDIRLIWNRTLAEYPCTPAECPECLIVHGPMDCKARE